MRDDCFHIFMYKKGIAVLLGLAMMACAFGQIKDSLLLKKSFFAIPYASYQQETSWAFGAAGGYYFKSNDLSKISSVTASVGYTLLNQFSLNITPKIYFGNKKWYLYSGIAVRKYPDFYYGVDDKPTDIKIGYTDNKFEFFLQPQYYVLENLYVGLLLSYRNESVKTDSTFEAEKNYIYNQYGQAGWEQFSQLTSGVVVSYDSRDNQFYPYSGLLAKTVLGVGNKNFLSSYSLANLSLDVRKYVPLFGNHVWATQMYYNGVFGSDEVPFQLLPTLGGIDMLRGFRQGMFRGKESVILQTEYRLPVYNKLKAALFCGTGQVWTGPVDLSDKLKFAYGAGLRYQLNDSRVHLRFDLAKNNYENQWQFYLTASEAF